MIINMLLRGRSLEYYRDIEDEPDIVYLVNDMHREVDSVEGLKDYLLDKNINLTMSLVKGSESGFLKINFFNDFNVTRLIRPYLEGLRQDEQDIPMKSTFLDNIHIPFMQIGHKYPYEYPGTGIAAIADAVLTIFKTRYDLDIFKKKALYIYIREMTDCETPHLTRVISVLKDDFYEIYYRYHEKGRIVIKEQ